MNSGGRRNPLSSQDSLEVLKEPQRIIKYQIWVGHYCIMEKLVSSVSNRPASHRPRPKLLAIKGLGLDLGQQEKIYCRHLKFLDAAWDESPDISSVGTGPKGMGHRLALKIVNTLIKHGEDKKLFFSPKKYKTLYLLSLPSPSSCIGVLLLVYYYILHQPQLYSLYETHSHSQRIKDHKHSKSLKLSLSFTSILATLLNTNMHRDRARARGRGRGRATNTGANSNWVQKGTVNSAHSPVILLHPFSHFFLLFFIFKYSNFSMEKIRVLCRICDFSFVEWCYDIWVIFFRLRNENCIRNLQLVVTLFLLL